MAKKIKKTDLEIMRDDMVAHGFSELIGQQIEIDFVQDPVDDELASYGTTSEGFFIDINPSFKTAPVEVIQGAIAHELAHILADLEERKLPWIERALESLAYKISKRLRALDERSADLEAIRRGYGSQLLALLRYNEEKFGLKWSKEKGLSVEEVESLL